LSYESKCRKELGDVRVGSVPGSKRQEANSYIVDASFSAFVRWAKDLSLLSDEGAVSNDNCKL